MFANGIQSKPSVYCELCLAGRYGPSGHHSKNSKCFGRCAAGRYGRPGSKRAICSGACSAGRWGAAGETSPTCHLSCPTGKFSRDEDALSYVSGKLFGVLWATLTTAQLKASTRSKQGEVMLQTGQCQGECPRGRYGSKKYDGCVVCFKGMYQPHRGQIRCLKCPAGNVFQSCLCI